MGNLLDRFFDWIDSWFDDLDNEELDDYGYEKDGDVCEGESEGGKGSEQAHCANPQGDDETGNC
jgi:hypothetical protein